MEIKIINKKMTYVDFRNIKKPKQSVSMSTQILSNAARGGEYLS